MAVEDAAVLARSLSASRKVEAALALYARNRMPRTRRIVDESRDNRRLFHLKSVEELRAAFAQRNMDRERSNWLYNYNPLEVPLA